MEEQVILVNEKDEPIGLMGKMEAHEKGLLHRAFSVFIFNSQGELLLQQRAASKYHSPNLWTNTCCSHPRIGETNQQAGERRLEEEMGLKDPLKEVFSFVYNAPFDNGLIEYEYDYVLVGYSDAIPQINPEEVASWKWLSLEAVKEDILQAPEQYTAWFKIIFEEFYYHLQDK